MLCLLNNVMSRMIQIRKIYTNMLFCTEKYLKNNTKSRLDLSYYKLAYMNEKDILNNLEKLSNIISHNENDKLH